MLYLLIPSAHFNHAKWIFSDIFKNYTSPCRYIPALTARGSNPLGKLPNLHPEKYTLLDCEPLHDLHGHLIHISVTFSFEWKHKKRSERYSRLLLLYLSQRHWLTSTGPSQHCSLYLISFTYQHRLYKLTWHRHELHIYMQEWQNIYNYV